MSLQDVFASHVLQAEFTHIKLLQSGGKKRKKKQNKDGFRCTRTNEELPSSAGGVMWRNGGEGGALP